MMERAGQHRCRSDLPTHYSINTRTCAPKRNSYITLCRFMQLQCDLISVTGSVFFASRSASQDSRQGQVYSLGSSHKDPKNVHCVLVSELAREWARKDRTRRQQPGSL